MLSLAVISAISVASLPSGAQPPDEFAAKIVLLHNLERASVGSPPLSWSPELAASAALYGPRLTSLGKLVHSPKAERPGQRENLARIQTSYATPDRLVGSWLSEKRNFVPGNFPNISRTGSWSDVAHYSQVVWKSTRQIGCSVARADGWDYLICRYSPPGNIDGEPVP